MAVERNATSMDMSNGNGSAGYATSARRMLYRNPSDRMLGGVCGGVADYLRWDPALVRVIWVGATLVTSGAGFLVYLLLWLLLPVGTQIDGQERAAAIQFNDAMGKRLAVVLMALGALWLLGNLGILPGLWGAAVVLLRLLFWPLLLIGIGYLLLNRSGSEAWRERMAGWRAGASEWANRTRSRMPEAGEVRSGAQDLRNRIPLRRSRSDRMVMGVCGGIGQALGIEPVLVRLLWVVLSLGSMGFGVVLYLVAGLLLPEESAEGAGVDTSQSVQELSIVDQRGAPQTGNPHETVQF